MAFDPRAIREALAQQIKDGVQREVNAYAYIPDSPAYPYVGIRSGTPYVTYHETMKSASVGALCDFQLVIEVAQNARTQDAQIFVDDLVAAGTGEMSSVVDAIEADRTLGGLVDTCVCLACEQGPTTNEDDGTTTAVLPVHIWLRRT